MKDIRYSDLLSILNLIYIGQAEVANEDLSRFMEAAFVLQIEGLKQVEDASQHVSTFKTDDVFQPDPSLTFTTGNEMALLDSCSETCFSQNDRETCIDSQIFNSNTTKIDAGNRVPVL